MLDMMTNIFKKIKSKRVVVSVQILTILLGVGFFGSTETASALEPGNCFEKNNGEIVQVTCPEGRLPSQSECFLVEEAINVDLLIVLDCETGEMIGNANSTAEGRGSSDGELAGGGDCDEDVLASDNCNIIKYLVSGIQFLSAIAGMAIIGSIMLAGYQYMTAKDNSGQVEAAKKRILWALIALGLFIFMFSLLNWLVPGGVL